MSGKGKSNQKVLAAMSGGVDSSVAAAMLVRAGYEVTGVFLCLGASGDGEVSASGCCSPQDAADARRVAAKLGIDLYVLNMADEFAAVIENFASEYLRGRTPNPCVHCNSTIKFGRLIRHADSVGASFVATGHYARIVSRDGRPAIARGLARGKDQSYALFAVPRENIGRILLPLGEVRDKAIVRSEALALGLSVHDKPDSQEICFVPDDDYAALLGRLAPEALRPGPIMDSSGRVLGRHDGYARFTVGQRRGLRVAAGRPLYVIRIDPANAAVVVGFKEEAVSSRLTASGANWQCDLPRGAGVDGSFEAAIQIRYNHAGTAGVVRPIGPDRFEVLFDRPVAAVTPGQAAVIYDGDVMLGGGWID